MVNEEKLRIMTRLASYENSVSEKEQKEGGYYRIDYIRSHLLVTVSSYSVAFALLLALIALYHFDYLVSAMDIRTIRSLILTSAAIYLLLLFGCIFFTITFYSGRYNRMQKRRKEYYQELKRLEAFYKKSGEEDNG